ncbi:MAG TPA: WD40 repeat domain-containing protein [Blastocatellia bacterium]|nr:WD40 repeat domain-containing protein [Blastocatellia bacterium]
MTSQSVATSIADQVIGFQFTRHHGPVTCVVGVPGSRIAVTSGYDGAVGRFDLDSGEATLLGYHDHLVNRITVDPQGTRAASSSSDYTIKIWDLKSGSVLQVLRGHADDVEDFAFAGRNKGVSASRDHRIHIWDLKTGAIDRIIEGHEKDVLSVVYYGGKIYSSGDDMTLRQWDFDTGRLLRTWGPFEQETDTCAIDPINRRAILGSDDGSILIFDVEDGRLIREITAHTSGIKKVTASPVSGDVLSAAYDRRVVVWDAMTFNVKADMEPIPGLWERSLNWSPDGQTILAGTFDGTVVEWDAASGRLLKEVGVNSGPGGNACFNDVSTTDAGETVLVSDDGHVRLARLTPETAAWTADIVPAPPRILMNAVTADAELGLVACGAHDHRLLIFKRTDAGLDMLSSVHLGEGPINCVRVSHNKGFEGDIFAACYSGAIVRVGSKGGVVGRYRIHKGAVKALRLHPGKPVGISCGADGLLLSWRLDGGLISRFPGHTAIVDDVDIDPGGELIASASRDFTLKVYQLADARLVHSICLGRHSPKSVCFASTDAVIVGDYWGSLLKVELPDGKIKRCVVARNGISSLAKASGGVLAASYDGGVYLVRTQDLSVVNTLRAMFQRPDAWPAAAALQ